LAKNGSRISRIYFIEKICIQVRKYRGGGDASQYNLTARYSGQWSILYERAGMQENDRFAASYDQNYKLK
jgi:hypothetical protein